MASSRPTRLLIATGNPGKMREYVSLLRGIPFELVSLRGLGITHEVDETGETFEENAWLKASEYAAISGVLTLADDSGLEVDALSGEPGVRSARYGGDYCTSDHDRVALLLKNLANVPWDERTARFRCEIAIVKPEKSALTPLYERGEPASPFLKGGREGDFPASAPALSHNATLLAQTEGSVAGMIQYRPQGDDGFGYDPVFYLPSYGKTIAQLSLDEKNTISHRAHAARKAIKILKKLTTDG
ncbi:MAG: non-canonical purine NTP pyrophosphatase [SAR202 cluster bacterium Io17-Chloro-G6]|nr:MAG: non-canonical purine NTP pyrophosphatase [SAR202 cluster bacterium Io17-Chloro-G6]